MLVSVLSTWGRRMGRKLELLRKNDPGLPSPGGTMSSTNRKKNIWRVGRSASESKDIPVNSCTSRDRSPSPFKSLFIRMGSTGMLNVNKPTNLSPNECDSRNNPNNNLFRSSSTSHLSASYIRGDDPSDGIDLHHCPSEEEDQRCSSTIGFASNYDDANYIINIPTKALSYDNISDLGTTNTTTKRCNFPYAFLRSKLSVLPEESVTSLGNQQRSFSLRISNNTSLKSSPKTKAQCFDSSSNIEYDCSSLKTDKKSARHSFNADLLSYNNLAKHNVLTRDDNLQVKDDNIYHRLSNYVSSNESGYDSDGRHQDESQTLHFITENCTNLEPDTESVTNDYAEKYWTTDKSPSKNHTKLVNNTVKMRKQEFLLSQLLQSDPVQEQHDLDLELSKQNATASAANVFENQINRDVYQTCKRQFRKVYLIKNCIEEHLGIHLTQQIVYLMHAQPCNEVRYVILKLEENSIAHRYFPINCLLFKDF